jgi:hypothetical protein
VTANSFDVRLAPFARGLFLGDYEGLTSQSGQFLALFAQTHGWDPASVFFARITP